MSDEILRICFDVLCCGIKLPYLLGDYTVILFFCGIILRIVLTIERKLSIMLRKHKRYKGSDEVE